MPGSPADPETQPPGERVRCAHLGLVSALCALCQCVSCEGARTDTRSCALVSRVCVTVSRSPAETQSTVTDADFEVTAVMIGSTAGVRTRVAVDTSGDGRWAAPSTASRITHRASHTAHRASRITHHASRAAHHAPISHLV
jgi:hypothetical protein